MKFLLFLFPAFLCVCVSNAQDNCAYETSSKIEKLIEQSRDTKKYEAEERQEFLEKTIEEDPNCLPCLMRLGEVGYMKGKRSGTFDEPRKHLEHLTELCAEYHSEQFYLLGAICYLSGDYVKAEEYFNKFLRFPDGDPSKFDRDYQTKYAEVEESLKSVKVYAEIYDPAIKFDPVKVNGVSTTGDEYLPFISPDGEVMFITRFVTKQAKGDLAPRQVEEFTWCKRPDINTEFDQGKALPDPFNLGNNCGGATISVDNRELIVAIKNPVPKNQNNVDLFSARYEMSVNDKGEKVYYWGELTSLGDNINTPEGWESQPSLSGDGKTLLFAAVRPECWKDGSGNFTHDIFISKKLTDGTWSASKPLGAEINTSGQEKAPYIHSDSHTMYFASSGHTGVGAMDIFYCQMNADGTFSTPKNIGYPINSTEDELGIVVSADGEVAYFGARNFRGNRGYDVYKFAMPEKAKPEKVMVMKGTATDVNGQPPQNAVVEINYASSKVKEEVQVNSDDGSYAAIVKLKTNETVTMSIKAEDVAFNTTMIVQQGKPAPSVVKVEVKTQESIENSPLVINDIYYLTNKADIEEQSKPILDAFADYLQSHPTMQVRIVGHTDNVGDDKANFALSAERAFEVVQYLVSLGVDAKRLKSEGKGETQPIADNNTDDGRAKNRRTEFVILKK
ncbi:MAG: OmpA family protein [Flavobacteriales bacterium]